MATTPKNLYEYYTQKGKKLPSWQERAPIYESLGLGKATEYTGSTEQNASLLQKLLAGGEGSVKEKPIVPETVMPPAGGDLTTGVKEQTSLPGLGEEVSNRATGGTTETETPQDKMIADLTNKLTAYENAPSLTEEKKRLEEEKGVLGLQTTVGSFEDEIAKTQTLLDSLEEDITQRTREYLVSEPQRRRILAKEQEPLITQLGTLERGYTAASGKLERTQADILQELGLLEQEKTTPLDLLEREVDIRSKIKDLTDTKVPGVVNSTFNEEGDLTIVLQDPTTGAITTQTIKGIGDKANQYQSITSSTDDQGNLTIIGITRDGKSEVLGTFKGVAGTKTTTTGAVTSLDDLAKLGYTRRGSPDGGWNFFKNGQPISAEQIVQETGIPLATLLTGSSNPADIKRLKQLRGSGGGASNEDIAD